MNVLMLSIDDRVFEKGSEVRERMAALAGLFDSLSILVFTRRARQAERSGRLSLYPTPAALSPLAFLRAVRLGSRILREAGGDAVITSQDAFANIVAFVLKRRFGLALQVQIHTDFLAPAFRRESPRNCLRYLLYRFSARRADCLRVVSQRIRRSLESRIQNLESRIAVLPVFVDVRAIAESVPAFDLRKKYTGARPIILMVGRLTREKRIGSALGIISELVQEFPNILLVVVGDGPEFQNLKRKTFSLKLADHVRFEGWQRDLVPYYQGADALLVTSRYEGYGRMLVEAAAAGLPIVATDVGIIGELLKPGEGVLAFRSPAEGAAALERMFREPGLADQLRTNARRAVLSQATDFPAYLAAYRNAILRCVKT